MKQIFQDFKTGELIISDLPMPLLKKEGVIVRNRYSILSAGTERQTVSTAKAGLLSKAKKRPDLVRQVLDKVKREGIIATYEKVMSRLQTYRALGYSCAGTVLHSSCDEFNPGDNVACGGGGYAVHAECVWIPKNLCVKIPHGVAFEEAAFTTIGAIAMQGLRQAEVTLGNNVVVIGLGLVGLLTIQLLQAAGCRVLGADISTANFDLAMGIGCNKTSLMEDVIDSCKEFSFGQGVDVVILTAATKSDDPINISGEIVRKKGKVVVLGSVGMKVQRDPYFYQKEIDIRFSTSYGPGRYDPSYEEDGNDYPLGYVRWTENRNMEAFLDLISRDKLQISKLISHTFAISDALEAYDLLLKKNSDPYVGIVLSYNGEDKNEGKTLYSIKGNQSNVSVSSSPKKILTVGVIGAGNFAKSYILPRLCNDKSVYLKCICTTNGISAKNAAEKFKIESFTTDVDDIFLNNEIDAVWIATSHDSHADLVIRALNHGKSTFVEKPLAITPEELEEVGKAYKSSDALLMVGYNRRFSKPAQKMKDFLQTIQGPFIASYRVNAGFIPAEEWYQHPGQGGRIVGEACHFVDFFQYLSGSKPINVYAHSISSMDRQQNAENVIITLKFEDGSVASIHYIAIGNSGLPKERCEISANGNSIVLDNYKKLKIYSKRKCKTMTYNGSKGQKEEITATVEAFLKGDSSPIGFDSLYDTTDVTLKAIESLNNNFDVKI